MFKNKGYSTQRLLVSFTTVLVVLIIITAFISYTSEITREARINMLKITKTQLKSANRMLLSRATILNLQANPKLDARLIDESHQGGILTYGEMLSSQDNIPIFISVNQLIVVSGPINGDVFFYPEGLKNSACSLQYSQPYMSIDEIGTFHRHEAQYRLNVKEC